MKNMIIMIFAFTFLSACLETRESVTEDYIEWIYTADPTTDAERFIKNDDYRLLGIYSHNIIIPGIDINCHISPTKIRVIEKTSDFYPNYSVAKFNAMARVYADYYNARMTSHYRDNGWKICNIE